MRLLRSALDTMGFRGLVLRGLRPRGFGAHTRTRGLGVRGLGV